MSKLYLYGFLELWIMYSKTISTIPVTWVQYLTTMRQTTHIGMPQAYPTKLLKYEGERNVNTYWAWNGTCQPWWPLMTLLHWYPIIPLKSPQLAWRRSVIRCLKSTGIIDCAIVIWLGTYTVVPIMVTRWHNPLKDNTTKELRKLLAKSNH